MAATIEASTSAIAAFSSSNSQSGRRSSSNSSLIRSKKMNKSTGLKSSCEGRGTEQSWLQTYLHLPHLPRGGDPACSAHAQAGCTSLPTTGISAIGEQTTKIYTKQVSQEANLHIWWEPNISLQWMLSETIWKRKVLQIWAFFAM